jgi:hypothetical protein
VEFDLSEPLGGDLDKYVIYQNSGSFNLVDYSSTNGQTTLGDDFNASVLTSQIIVDLAKDIACCGDQGATDITAKIIKCRIYFNGVNYFESGASCP